jgi:uncharacterized membrane protein YfcA
MGFEVAGEVLALLVLAAFCAGFVDSIAGGGGLITIPALLLAGAPPVTALATNKVQGVFGAASAAVYYARAGQVDPHAVALPAVGAFAAAALGASLAAWLPAETIRAGLPVVLIAIAGWFAFRRGLGDEDRAARIGPWALWAGVVPAVALYDGLVGPGTGSFYMLALVALGGLGVLKATAQTKVLNSASNLGGLAAFALVALPWWWVGLAMGAAQVAGAQIGARLAVRAGARLIRPVLVVTSTALALRLIWEQL